MKSTPVFAIIHTIKFPHTIKHAERLDCKVKNTRKTFSIFSVCDFRVRCNYYEGLDSDIHIKCMYVCVRSCKYERQCGVFIFMFDGVCVCVWFIARKISRKEIKVHRNFTEIRNICVWLVRCYLLFHSLDLLVPLCFSRIDSLLLRHRSLVLRHISNVCLLNNITLNKWINWLDKQYQFNVIINDPNKFCGSQLQIDARKKNNTE